MSAIARWVVCLGLWLCLGAWTHGTTAPQTADPLASQATQNVLTYLQNVGRRSNHRVVTGQYFGAAGYEAAGWTTNIVALYSATGQYPGIVGADYNDWNANSTPPDVVDYTTLNNYIKTAATSGSIITIGWHARNPFVDASVSDMRCNGGTLADLVNPSTAITVLGTSTSVYAAWHAQLDAIAAGLGDLQASAIPILWRPLLEQNSSSYWYMSCNQNMAQFQALWVDMFNYLTVAKGLHNLLWVFASNGPWQNTGGCPGVQGESGICLYPGAAYVDVVGLDGYSNTTGPMPDAFTDDWRAWSRFGKVLVFAERGPSYKSWAASTAYAAGYIIGTADKYGNYGYITNASCVSGSTVPVGAANVTDGTCNWIYSIDPTNMWGRILPDLVSNGKSSVPAVPYFQAWAFPWSIAASPGATTLMSDPNAANQADVAAVMACMATATTYAARVACALN